MILNSPYISGSLTVTGNSTFTGTMTATTLVVQTVTSSVNFITGSTKFGSLIGNTHQFTGSVSMTGSLAVITNGTEFQVNSTGVNLGNALTDAHTITGSMAVTGGLVDINRAGQSLRIFPQTSSGSARIQMQNSGSGGLAGANAIIAVESSTGADQFSGTSPFSLVIGTATQKAFHLGANSAVVMTITGSNVGIGTSSPSFKLDVIGGIRVNEDGAGTKVIQIRSDFAGVDPAINVSTNNALLLQTNNTERMRITSDGNVTINSAQQIYAKLNIKQTNNQLYGGIAIYSTDGTETFLGLGNVGSTVGLFATYGSNGAYVPITFSTGGSERMRITSGGNVQIDNAQLNSPKSLSFQANSSAGGNLGSIDWYNFQWDAAIRAQIKGETDTGLSNGKLTFWTGGGGTSLRMTINSAGSIGAPSGTNIYNASDLRLKRNITTITDGLDKVMGLNPVKFNWIEGFELTEEDKDMLGFIAQEVQNVIPEAVENFSNNTITVGNTTIENTLRVNEKFIIPVLVKAIQELKSQNDSLQSQINELKAQ